MTNWDIINLAEIERDEWVKFSIKKHFNWDGVVLDVGAGSCPYKLDLKSYNYISHDCYNWNFDMDVVSDISEIPLPDESVDFILCTEVLEHVPEPLLAFREFSRLIRTNGKIIITTPFNSGVHQEPQYFYSGFSKYFFEYAAQKNNFLIKEISTHGNFFRFLSQEISRLLILGQESLVSFDVKDWQSQLLTIANDLLYKDEQCSIDQFCIGYRVVLEKK